MITMDPQGTSIIIVCSLGLPVCSAAIFCSANVGACSGGLICSGTAAGACSGGVLCSGQTATIAACSASIHGCSGQVGVVGVGVCSANMAGACSGQASVVGAGACSVQMAGVCSGQAGIGLAACSAQLGSACSAQIGAGPGACSAQIGGACSAQGGVGPWQGACSASGGQKCGTQHSNFCGPSLHEQKALAGLYIDQLQTGEVEIEMTLRGYNGGGFSIYRYQAEDDVWFRVSDGGIKENYVLRVIDRPKLLENATYKIRLTDKKGITVEYGPVEVSFNQNRTLQDEESYKGILGLVFDRLIKSKTALALVDP